jgi:hypothetical protein
MSRLEHNKNIRVESAIGKNCVLGTAWSSEPAVLVRLESSAAIRWAERLRKVTVKAPLQSLFVAFLLGIWVARRR